VFLFELLFQLIEGIQSLPVEFANPPLADLVNWHRIEIVKFFSSAPNRGDKVCLFQDG
jgi:hypothetical protein